MKIRTVNLTGLALDWAVCTAAGHTSLYLADYGRLFSSTHDWGVSKPGYKRLSPTTKPEQAWTLIDKYNIVVIGNGMGLFHASFGAQWDYHTRQMDSPAAWIEGHDKLTAAMRSYVHHFLGWEVDVPDDFLTAK